MRSRLFQVFVLFAVAAAAFAGTARALDFDDEDPNPPKAEIGLVYDYEIGTHAGCLPHRVVILSGQLPPGLKLSQVDADTALVSGIATETGTFSAWLAVKDCENKSAEALFTFEVWARRWSITTTTLPAASVGSPYSAKLESAGIKSNVAYEVTAGSLPAGLTLAPDGTISGTPTAGGSSPFTVQGSAESLDPAAPGTRIDSHQYTLTVGAALSASLTRRVAEVGIPVRSGLVASGGTAPYVWTPNGALPAGLVLNADGSLSGAPSRAGSYTLTAHVRDASGGARDIQVSLVVHQRLVITAKRLPSAGAGHAYRARIATRGGVAPLQWSGKLPRGLRLDPQRGAISGTAPRAGRFRVTVRARDSLGAVSTKSLVLTVR
jgi:hypothetical protein